MPWNGVVFTCGLPPVDTPTPGSVSESKVIRPKRMRSFICVSAPSAFCANEHVTGFARMPYSRETMLPLQMPLEQVPVKSVALPRMAVPLGPTPRPSVVPLSPPGASTHAAGFCTLAFEAVGSWATIR